MGLAASACTSASVSTGPSPVKCLVSLATSNPAVNAEGGAGSVAVTTERECSWSVSSEASSITIASPASGQGEGTIEYRVSANPGTVARTGAIAVNNQRAEIAQAAGACRFTIAPVSESVADTGATASVTVTAGGNCAWTAVSEVSWVTITGGSDGTGDGTVNFTVAANSTAIPRSGTLTVAGQTSSQSTNTGHWVLVRYQSDLPVSVRRREPRDHHCGHRDARVRLDRRRAAPAGSLISRRAAALGTAP